MTDIITSGKRSRSSGKTPRIDLTPMVDLGFLLITFFMYTTSLAKQKVMDIQMPYESKDPAQQTAWPEESTVTLIHTSAHWALWYTGNVRAPQYISICNYSGKHSLRERLIEGKKYAAGLPANYSKEAHLLHVLIKPDVSNTYDDLVKTLDEMNLNEVQRYAMADVSVEDATLLKAYRK